VLDVFRCVSTPMAAVLYALFLRHIGMDLRKIAYTDSALYYESACRILGLEHHVYTFGSWLHTVIESVICTQIKDIITTSHEDMYVGACMELDKTKKK